MIIEYIKRFVICDLHAQYIHNTRMYICSSCSVSVSLSLSAYDASHMILLYLFGHRADYTMNIISFDFYFPTIHLDTSSCCLFQLWIHRKRNRTAMHISIFIIVHSLDALVALCSWTGNILRDPKPTRPRGINNS